mmetsp:Transcript_71183/g.170476  ORF Transcript_71183/g.170476 Transcript_71183/m.170476 type:complete len:257 (+) Transcript_71183:29-799(+)
MPGEATHEESADLSGTSSLGSYAPMPRFPILLYELSTAHESFGSFLAALSCPDPGSMPNTSAAHMTANAKNITGDDHSFVRGRANITLKTYVSTEAAPCDTVFTRLEHSFTSIVAVQPAGIQISTQQRTFESQPTKKPRAQGEFWYRISSLLITSGKPNTRKVLTITSPRTSCAFCSYNLPLCCFKNFSTKSAPKQFELMEQNMNNTPVKSGRYLSASVPPSASPNERSSDNSDCTYENATKATVRARRDAHCCTE